MKKNYQNPEMEILKMEFSESFLQGSYIDIGGSGTLDASHKKETSDIWDNPLNK